MSKANYVRTQAARGHDGTHKCHAQGCDKPVAPAFLMCSRHWRMVPVAEQRAIWRHFRPGQERDKRPTQEYLLALHAAVAAVAKREGVQPLLPIGVGP